MTAVVTPWRCCVFILLCAFSVGCRRPNLVAELESFSRIAAKHDCTWSVTFQSRERVDVLVRVRALTMEEYREVSDQILLEVKKRDFSLVDTVRTMSVVESLPERGDLQVDTLNESNLFEWAVSARHARAKVEGPSKVEEVEGPGLDNR